MMIPNIVDKRFVILGLQGTGKTYLAKHLLGQMPASIAYDVMHEYQGFNRYIVKYRQYGQEAVDELNMFVSKVVIGSKKIKLFILDEANRFCPAKPHPLPDSILELNDWQRHYHVTFGAICRRPTQLHSDLIELAHYVFIFQLKGKNDLIYLDAIAGGLGDKVLALPQYHFVILQPNHEYQVHAPIAI
jgi:hypothetical protein